MKKCINIIPVLSNDVIIPHGVRVFPIPPRIEKVQYLDMETNVKNWTFENK